MASRYQVTIVGGGIAGASIAYHLSALGCRDVAILEQSEPVSGTTSHAPGLVGQLRSSDSLMQVLQYSVALYRTLSVDGVAGYIGEGSLRLASSPARWKQICEQAKQAQAAGLDVQLVNRKEIERMAPIVDLTGVEGALHVPSDGSANAPILAQAMLRQAVERGVTVHSHCHVNSIELANGRVRTLITNQGRLETETLVVAAGIWSPRITTLAGVQIPLIPMMHQYAASVDLPQLAGRTIPNLRDPDHLIYFRQRNGHLLFGGYERDPVTFDVDAIPDSINPTVREFDTGRFEPLLRAAEKRIPIVADRPLAQTVNGLESFTIDGHFLLGPAPSVSNLWSACGFCAHGVSSAGGIGQALAEWIVHGDPGVDLSEMSLSRFGGRSYSTGAIRRGAVQVYSTYYDFPTASVDSP
jgi:4-methylaminobutanoate oxidase (formaldehyde-forming)